MTILETKRLRLRRLRPNDAKAMHSLFGDAEVMHYGDGVKTLEWVREWLRRWVEEHYPTWGFGVWAVVERGGERVIGYCGLSRFAERCAPDETELGYRLARPYWGHGFATEAALAVRDFGFKTLGVRRLIAMIDPGNIASIRVAEKIGMRYVRDVMFEGYTHPDRVYAVEKLPRDPTGN